LLKIGSIKIGFDFLINFVKVEREYTQSAKTSKNVNPLEKIK
jgi:hypothetical protein